MKGKQLLWAWLVWAAGCAFSPALSRAQALTFVRSIPLEKPGALSLDRQHQVYVTDGRGNLHKFTAEGQLVQTYSPRQTGRVALVEAWNMLKVFVFYDGQGQAVLLDRFLNPISSTNFNDQTEGVVRLATLAADDRFWVFNESDFSLLKIDPRRGEETVRTPLNQIMSLQRYDLRFMREYQNILYLVDRNSGIYLFDNMGNYKKKLAFPGLSYVGFLGDQVYFLSGGEIHFFNLYTLVEKTLPVPAGKDYQQVLVGDGLVYLVSDRGLDIYLLPQ